MWWISGFLEITGTSCAKGIVKFKPKYVKHDTTSINFPAYDQTFFLPKTHLFSDNIHYFGLQGTFNIGIRLAKFREARLSSSHLRTEQFVLHDIKLFLDFKVTRHHKHMEATVS